MKITDLKSQVSSLKGIGPTASALFAKLNIFTVSDLLQFYPRTYEDRREKNPIANFQNKPVNTIAQVTAHEWFGYGKMKSLKIIIRDESTSASLVAFNRSFLQKSLPVGSIICVSGDFSLKYGQIQSSSFDVSKIAENDSLENYKNQPLPNSQIFPIYHLTQGLNQKNVRKAISLAISQYLHGIEDEIPSNLIQKHKLFAKTKAIIAIHEPSTMEEIQIARKTLIYEELFKFQLAIAQRAFKHKGILPSIQIETDFSQEKITENQKTATETETPQEFLAFKENLSPRQNQLFERLPFSLTKDQKSVISQMNLDIDKGYKERAKILNSTENNDSEDFFQPFTMTRLLQGDVGSGKTLAAFFACLRIIDWKGQCAFMAPTEILARQHAENAAHLLEPLGIKVAFLSGNVQSKGRSQLLKALKEGDIDIVVGTHALFSKQTVYNDLQLAIIDEQHRFGVLQRQAIIEKGRKTEACLKTDSEISNTNENEHKIQKITLEPHLLMMSATPIPQTLALTVFGDLDVSIIKSMPKGRLPIQTLLVREGNEMNAYNAVKKELQKGHQAYFVYPAIENEDSTKDLKAAAQTFDVLSKEIFPEYNCALLHSKIPEEEQIKVLKDFKDGKIQVLAATTVIEVGVDVPNATCIVIEMADRFGLAQLHQLRGRVGRSNLQSFCFLIYSSKITQTGIERMKILRQSTDGFEIANEDLKLRGPGEITGTAQAGNIQLGIADFVRDKDLLILARYDAFNYWTTQNNSKKKAPSIKS